MFWASWGVELLWDNVFKLPDDNVFKIGAVFIFCWDCYILCIFYFDELAKDLLRTWFGFVIIEFIFSFGDTVVFIIFD